MQLGHPAAQAALYAASWERCGAGHGCRGAALWGAGSPCLLHAEPSDRASHLSSGAPIDIRGVVVDQPLCDEICDALEGGRGLVTGELLCTAATFACDLILTSVTFERPVSFSAATFTGRVSLGAVTFQALTRFDGAVFGGLRGPRVDGRTEAATRFLDCSFQSRTRFGQAVFCGQTSFARSTFAQHASFVGTQFAANVRFDRATFERTRSLELLDVEGACHLDFATFDRFVTLSLGVGVLNCGGTQFRDGVNMRVVHGDLILEHSDFGPASTVSLYRLAGFRERIDDLDPMGRDGSGAADASPRLLSLRGSSIRGFEISGIDLRPCLFAGAHGLEGLHLDSTVTLGLPPASGSLVPPRRWVRRDVVAEERRWRAERDRWSEWTVGPQYALPETLRGVRPLAASEIADIYRALRKGREDKRDAAGAEDFYYGEMEMRRHAVRYPTTPRGGRLERSLIWTYWATSGYALRPFRSLAALGLVIAVFSILIAALGSACHLPYSDALLTTIQAATLRNPGQSQLNDVGRWLELPLRLLGPLFFALTLLALRGRVKR